MLSVDPFDKYLDPPDGCYYSECDRCGNMFDNGDLEIVGDQWLCRECAIEELDEAEDE